MKRLDADMSIPFPRRYGSAPPDLKFSIDNSRRDAPLPQHPWVQHPTPPPGKTRIQRVAQIVAHRFRTWALNRRIASLACILILLSVTALTSYIAKGMTLYTRNTPPWYANYRQGCVPSSHLYSVDYARSIGFPPPLLPGLKFLSISRGTARSRLKHYQLCFIGAKCQQFNTNVTQQHCNEVLKLAEDAFKKLGAVTSYPRTIREYVNETAYDVNIEDSIAWNTPIKVTKLGMPMQKEKCAECRLRDALLAAAHQVISHKIPEVPSTMEKAAESNWCQCDVGTAVASFTFPIDVVPPSWWHPIFSHIRWPGLAKLWQGPWFWKVRWSSTRLPPRVIAEEWWDDSAWEMGPAPQSFSLWEALSDCVFRAYLWALRTHGRGCWLLCGEWDDARCQEIAQATPEREMRWIVRQGWLDSDVFGAAWPGTDEKDSKNSTDT